MDESPGSAQEMVTESWETEVAVGRAGLSGKLDWAWAPVAIQAVTAKASSIAAASARPAPLVLPGIPVCIASLRFVSFQLLLIVLVSAPSGLVVFVPYSGGPSSSVRVVASFPPPDGQRAPCWFHARPPRGLALSGLAAIRSIADASGLPDQYFNASISTIGL